MYIIYALHPHTYIDVNHWSDFKAGLYGFIWGFLLDQ